MIYAGKTSLVGSIIKSPNKNPNNLATVGVEKHDWFYKGQLTVGVEYWDIVVFITSTIQNFLKKVDDKV